MKKLNLIAFAAVLSFAGCAASPALAQSLKVATGGATGTYSKMLKEIGASCGSVVTITEQPTSGSIENVNLIVGNQVNGALVQTDVLYYRSQTEDLGGIKTLLTLHPEEIHVVALDIAQKSGGVLASVGLGDKPNPLDTLKQMTGRTMGAVGGSFITAQVIRLQSEINFKTVEYPDNAALLKALDARQVDAALLVGGAPLGAVSGLKGAYKLLPFSDDVVAKLKNVYRPARLNYSNINARGVPTIATDALFVTREYKTAKFTAALGALRSCIVDNIDEFKETTGMHPKWQLVDPSNKGKWPYYELPAVTLTAASPVAAPKKR